MCTGGLLLTSWPVYSLHRFLPNNFLPDVRNLSLADLYERMDILAPYVGHHGPKHRSHRDTTECQQIKYGNVTHSKHPVLKNDTTVLPLTESYFFFRQVGDNYWSQHPIYVNHHIARNPLNTVSVLEPGNIGGCKNMTRATVQDSSQQKQCIVTINAGYFNTKTGQCIGNVISDRRQVQDSGGVQNAHFGITEDGHIFTGYLSELDLVYQGFTQLVGGVLWLVRDGESYVDQASNVECSGAEETGSFERFINVQSARTAVGHDTLGRVHFVQVNGKTDEMGINLYEFSSLLIELGLFNAINLDGGGSATTVINNTLRNYPSDKCEDGINNCAREVSTVLCMHPPRCSPPDCSNHGFCNLGVCECRGRWSGSACAVLECPKNCSGRGKCSEEGCQCYPGWYGDECSHQCPATHYGSNCSWPCMCHNGGQCDPVTGHCNCLPGFTGDYCQSACSFGYFGAGCHEVCLCNSSCYCDHITGSCDVMVPDSDYLKAGKCLADQEIKRSHLVPENKQQLLICFSSVVGIAVMALASLLLNVALTYKLMRVKKSHHKNTRRQTRQGVKRALRGTYSHDSSSDELIVRNGVVRSLGGGDGETGSGEEEDDLFLAPKK